MRARVSRLPGWAVRALCGVAIAAAIPVIAWNGFVQQAGAQLTDILLRLRAPAGTPGVREVVLVAIDDGTASRYGPLPLRRSILAEGIEKLAQLHPTVIALDILVAEPGDAAGDAALAGALGRAPHAIVSAALDAGGGRERWVQPIPGLAAIATTAHVHAAQDSDGVVRSILLAKVAGNRRHWALALEAVRAARRSTVVERADSVSVGGITIPAPDARARMMLINFAGPEGTFRRVPFSALLDGTADPAAFRDRIVIVGVTAQGSGDRLFTPVSSSIGMSGIEIHANAIRTILDGAFLVPLSPLSEYATCTAVALLCFLLARTLRGARLALAFAAAGLAVPVVCAVALRFGSVWPIGALGAVFVLSALAAGAGEYGLVWSHLHAEQLKRKEYAFRVQAIAHEIKTPLTAIQGSSEIVADEHMPERARAELAGLIHKESKRLTAIVEAFLSVERMAAGSLKLEKQAIDARPFFEDVLERARLYAARKRISIESDVRLAALDGDPDLLSFALYNLLTNAVKYSPKGTTVRLSATEEDGFIVISVRDQGYGIAASDRERIFDRFYRSKRDEKGPEAGTGIGLALVREIVTQHGGRITVESMPDAGSCFTMELPK